ncbi:hypothetical protein HN358_02360 [Candidatus Uhrbacteria bacterium]|jgi:hypothetical protein|nr:hypothetical protein [Candidatus Uhrbacteria bacterium]MBT7717522.1 hypothetical protein [Candidatus Uhrbacteria bacterium]
MGTGDVRTSYEPRVESSGGGMWDATPEVGSLTRDQVEAVYSGDTTVVLDKFKEMTPEVRDRAIIGLSTDISEAIMGLCEMTAALESFSDPENEKLVRQALDSIDKLSALDNEAMGLFEGAGFDMGDE